MDYQLDFRIKLWMEEVAERLRESLNQKVEIQEKQGAADLVTEMDRWAETYFVEKITTYYPDHQIIGEEGISDTPVTSTKGITWLIDPIDGTLNYVKEKNYFGIMVGIFEDGVPVAGYIYDVMNHDLYSGIVSEGVFLNNKPLTPIQVDSISSSLVVGNVGNYVENRYNLQAIHHLALGTRSYGAAALEIIAVLRGEVCLYASTGLNPWDFGAGYALCKALGFEVTTFTNEPLNIMEKSPVIFAPKHIHAEALKLLEV